MAGSRTPWIVAVAAATGGGAFLWYYLAKKKKCEAGGGQLKGLKCTCPNGQTWDPVQNKCVPAGGGGEGQPKSQITVVSIEAV